MGSDNARQAQLPQELIGVAFGAGRLRAIRPVTGGTVNLAWRLEIDGIGPAILRLAPSPGEAAAGPAWLTSHGLRREQAVMRLLPHLAHLLPHTLHVDFTRSMTDRDWIVQRLVDGVAWSELTLDDATTADLWRQAGALCRSIHDVHGDRFGGVAGPETGFSADAWSAVLQDDCRGLLTDAARFDLDTEPFRRLIETSARHREVIDLVRIPSLIHSDLSPRHIFVAPDAHDRWTITGLIDLEFGRFADPLSESQIELLELMPSDPRCRDAFWNGYGPHATPPGAGIRARIYQAVALGWVATDLARRNLRADIPEVVSQLDACLAALG